MIINDGDLLRFRPRADDCGKLIVWEKGDGLPFVPVRAYCMYGVSGVRGCHAHRELESVMVCTSGSCTVLLDDGETRRAHRLESPDVGLHIKPGLWREMRDFSDDCVLLVLASAPYDATDYIHDYDAFLQEAKAQKKHSPMKTTGRGNLRRQIAVLVFDGSKRMEFVRFLFVGGSGTVLSYSVYLAGLWFGATPVWAFNISFVFSVCYSYCVHLKVTFRQKHHWRKMALFPLNVAMHYVVGLVSLQFFISQGVPAEYAGLLILPFSALLSFFFSRLLLR